MIFNDITSRTRPGINKVIASKSMVQVRDSRTGYFIPARYGMRVWPDGRVVGKPSASWGFGLGFGFWDGVLGLGLGFGIGFRDRVLGLGLGIGLWDWVLGLGFGIGFYGIKVWDWVWGYKFGIGLYILAYSGVIPAYIDI